MVDARQGRLLRKGDLTAAEYVDVLRLAALCNAHEGLDLKLNLDIIQPGAATLRTIYVLAYLDGVLVGFACMEDAGDYETCGMVDPAYRRLGIGRALLRGVRAAATERSLDHVLIVCDDASASGRAFLSQFGVKHEFSEHRMLHDTSVPLPPLDDRITIRPAARTDVETIASIRAAAFGDDAHASTATIESDMLNPGERFYVGLFEGEPVATLKVTYATQRAYIYAFGVRPDVQGQGVGRQVLAHLLPELARQGRSDVALEVVTTNTRALRAYTGSGFRTLTTYGYYQLDLARLPA